MRKAAAIVTSCVLSVAPRAANAAEASAFEYEASPSCPDRAAFLSEVRARTDEWHESATASRTFIVRLTVDRDDRAHGSLVIARSGKRGAPRVLNAATCADAVRALSFIVALAIDPDAKAPATSPYVADATTSPDGRPRSDEVASSPAPAPPPEAITRIAPIASPAERRTTGERAPAISWSAGLSVDVLGLAAPGPVVGGGVFAGVRPTPRFDVRLSVHQTLSSAINVEGTRTSITWTTGRIEPCFTVVHAGRLDVGPCAMLEIGRVAAEGGGVEQTESPRRLWASGGAATRAGLMLVDALRLELAVGLFVPFNRTEFAYRPALLVYRAPAAGASASLSAVASWR